MTFYWFIIAITCNMLHYCSGVQIDPYISAIYFLCFSQNDNDWIGIEFPF